MDYSFEELTIKKLVDLIDKNKIDLSPSYQRNFIWSPKDQSELVDTILRGYPLPSFFLYEKSFGNFEMVDGQQRSRTIYRFVKGKITSSKTTDNLQFSDCNEEEVFNYKLPVILLKNLSNEDSLNEFYVLINKKGKHLNTPELYKSEFYDTNFFNLSEEVLSYQGLIDLNLFTEATSKRMNDRAFIEELLGYLKHGIKDKKAAVESIYLDKDIDEKECIELENKFYRIIDIISSFNEIYPVNKTRYRQKNDFYTLFNFVNENLNLHEDLLKYQYQILLVLNRKDGEGNQFIRPSNEECESLREYAINCVSQSNSKNAREKRLSFFNDILKNRNTENNEAFKDVLNYLGKIFGEDQIQLITKNDFILLDVSTFN